MTLRGGFVGCVTAVLGAAFTAGCAGIPSNHDDTAAIVNKIPDRTVVDHVTGCRYLKDDKHPDKPKECLPNDSPRREMK